MRLATFALKSNPHYPRLGVLSGARMLDLAQCALPVQTMKQLLAQGKAGLDEVRRHLDKPKAGALREFSDVIFLPPIPDADKFLCVGKNYRAHLEELKRTDLIKEMPGEPTGFVKLNTCLVGHEAEVERPQTVTHLDYEPELVFVVGKHVFGGKKKDAFDCVAGITNPVMRVFCR